MDVTGVGKAVESASDLVTGLLDRWWPKDASAESKLEAQTEITKSIQTRDAAVADSKAKVMVAELNQGDLFTKRARPMLIYAGLAFIGLVHVILPVTMDIVSLVIAFAVTTITPEQATVIESVGNYKLPAGFWTGWSGAVGVYAIGRSAEKRGATNKVISMITGNY